MVFSTITLSARQTLAPDGMLGRIHSAYRVISASGLLLGAALGGPLASHFGLTAPFWFGVIALTAVTLAVWRPLRTDQYLAN
jgi:predicted MFS family arabinose efflux permease